MPQEDGCLSSVFSVRARPPRAARTASRAKWEAKLGLVDTEWKKAHEPPKSDDAVFCKECVNYTFARAFHVCQKRFCRVGALSIYQWPVLPLVYLSRPRSVFDLHDLSNKISTPVLFSAAILVNSVRSALFRGIAINRLNAVLANRGEMAIGKVYISVPWPFVPGDVCNLLKKFWWEIGCGTWRRFQHIMLQLRFVRANRRTYRDLFNMARVARSMDAVVY